MSSLRCRGQNHGFALPDAASLASSPVCRVCRPSSGLREGARQPSRPQRRGGACCGLAHAGLVLQQCPPQGRLPVHPPLPTSSPATFVLQVRTLDGRNLGYIPRDRTVLFQQVKTAPQRGLPGQACASVRCAVHLAMRQQSMLLAGYNRMSSLPTNANAPVHYCCYPRLCRTCASATCSQQGGRARRGCGAST